MLTETQWSEFEKRLALKREAEQEEKRRMEVCPATGGKHLPGLSRESEDLFCVRCRRTLKEVA